MAFVDNILRPNKALKRIKPPKEYAWVWIIALLVMVILLIELFCCYGLPAMKLLSTFHSGKYLVLLQNNNEIRSSGGFIGSYAVIDVQNFKLKDVKFQTNIYTLDRDFTNNNYIPPPIAIDRMLQGKSWALRDSNFDASFPEASEDILRFYKLETGDSVDGIIALNAQVIIDILKITGPIEMSKYNTTISADNFYQETQYQVDQAYFQNTENWAINEPKTILKDLFPEIISRISHKKIAVYKLIKQELHDKEILLYFTNPKKEAFIQAKNWAGEINQNIEDQDFLYINSNSYSGNKSSLSVKEGIEYQVDEIVLASEKKLIGNVKIRRSHIGSNDWPDGKNINLTRVYTPSSSVFVKAELNGNDVSPEIEFSTDAGKNCYSYVISTEPGQTNIFEISYLIPSQNDYHLLVQKQPGVINTALKVLYNQKVLFNGILEADTWVK